MKLETLLALREAADPLTPRLLVLFRCTLCNGTAATFPCTATCRRRAMGRTDRPGQYLVPIVTRADGSVLSPTEAARVEQILENERAPAPPAEETASP